MILGKACEIKEFITDHREGSTVCSEDHIKSPKAQSLVTVGRERVEQGLQVSSFIEARDKVACGTWEACSLGDLNVTGSTWRGGKGQNVKITVRLTA